MLYLFLFLALLYIVEKLFPFIKRLVTWVNSTALFLFDKLQLLAVATFVTYWLSFFIATA